MRSNPRDAGEALWTEPYFDDGGGDVLMTTRTVPFRRDDTFWGVATIDIAHHVKRRRDWNGAKTFDAGLAGVEVESHHKRSPYRRLHY